MNWFKKLYRILTGRSPEIPNPVPDHKVILYPDWVLDKDGSYKQRPIKIPLFPYQEKGVRRGIHRYQGRLLLGDEMGLGKTPQALAMAKTAGWFPVLIICPAGLKRNWEKESKKFLGMRAAVLATRTVPTDMYTRRQLLLGHEIFIINYEILDDWFDFLLEIDFKLIVIDEIHNIANKDTKRTKRATDLAMRIPYRIGLSGTPITNYPSDLYPILHILRPDLYDSYFKFCIQYCRPQRMRGRWIFKGARNLLKLNTELEENVMIRRRKKDVLPDLPKKSRYIVPVDIVNRKEYEKALDDFLNWLRRYDPSKVKGAERAEGLVKKGYLIRLTGILKLPAVMNWLDDFLAESSGKIIVGAVHHKVIEPLHERYPDISVVLDGTKTAKQKEKAKDRFEGDKKCRILFGNLKSAGEGHNLVAGNTSCTVEMGWKPSTHSQFEARIDRIGQKLPTSHYYLIGHDTVEEDVIELIQTKQKIFDAAIDGESIPQDMDIHDEFIKAMRRRF